jgi:glycine cleavage system regulatory protein
MVDNVERKIVSQGVSHYGSQGKLKVCLMEGDFTGEGMTKLHQTTNSSYRNQILEEITLLFMSHFITLLCHCIITFSHYLNLKYCHF